MEENRPKTKSFEDLLSWQKAHAFVLSIYEITKKFPKDELFGLTSQLKRAAVSIAANIAEGYKKQSKKEKIHFFNIAQGSLEECRYYLILTKDIKIITLEEYNYLKSNSDSASYMLNTYLYALQKDINK